MDGRGGQENGYRAASREARAPLTLTLMLLSLAGVGLGLGATSASARAVRAASMLRVGTQTLKLCASSPQAYCGTLSVPLDYATPAGPHIPIAYRFYPASAPPGGQAAGTVVPVEGGPGYPSIGSVAYELGGLPTGYSAMYGPLLTRWNMLAVDNRGTGESTPLNCPALQDFAGESGGEAFQQTAATCAAALNHRWKYSDGSWVHASDLFNSVPAAEDLAAVIAALGVGKVDLYGDSYGSFFAQVFASRFPQLVRSVILDSTYETVGLDPWYRSTIDSMPAAFDAACSRSPACASAAPGPSWPRIVALAESLDAHPISGVVPGPQGTMEKVSMEATGLVNLLSDAAEDTNIYRELDAAARALLDAGDPAPLLRLYAQRLAVDEAYFGEPVREYSVELYLATSCLDYPQLFDMDASPAARAQELATAEARAAGVDVQPVHHVAVACPGREHRGVHRLPGLAEPDRRAAADLRQPAAVSQLAAGARARRRARHVDARGRRSQGARRDRRSRALRRARQLDARRRGGRHRLRLDARAGVRRRSVGARLARRGLCARRLADPRGRCVRGAARRRTAAAAPRRGSTRRAPICAWRQRR